MKTIGTLFYRIASTLAMVLFALVIALPSSSAVKADPILNAAPQSDDFNRCSLNPIWSFENPAGLPAAKITGPFGGDATLTLTVPPGGDYTFSNTNQNAPRVIQSISDAGFEVEAKFNSPLGQPPTGAWNMQGILVKDTASAPGKTRWLRFELDTKFNSINYYIGYLDENGGLHHVAGPAVLNTQMTASPLYLRVLYNQATGDWSLGYSLGNYTTFHYAYTFNESTMGNYATAVAITPTGIGVFAASTNAGTSAVASGITSQVDYFRNVADSAFVDDSAGVIVTKTGLGSGNVTTACTGSGTQVHVTATAATGSFFAGWSGDVVSTANPLLLDLNRSYNLTATFNSGQPVELNNFLFIPTISR